MFPLHQIAHVGVSQSRGLKLFGREVILEEFQPTSSRYLIVTDGQTDRQTDESNLNTALSRGKNVWVVSHCHPYEAMKRCFHKPNVFPFRCRSRLLISSSSSSTNDMISVDCVVQEHCASERRYKARNSIIYVKMCDV